MISQIRFEPRRSDLNFLSDNLAQLFMNWFDLAWLLFDDMAWNGQTFFSDDLVRLYLN